MNNNDFIIVKGAKVHNLKNVDIKIPHNKLTVITGVSGSGKSSLAFDTIFAEAQRRYIDTLSPYARQFLGVHEKPDVDDIEGLSPAISIEQRVTSHNPRSTVGTVTEIYDFLRVLFARAGTQFCPNCNTIAQKQSVDEIVEKLVKHSNGTEITIFAPIVRGRKGHYRELFHNVLNDGFLRCRVDGKLIEITNNFQVDRYKIHNIEILIDKIKLNGNVKERIRYAVELSIKLSEGTVITNIYGNDILFSILLSCSNCNESFQEPEPNSFSFNSPYGMCSDCEGIGEVKEFEKNRIINKTLSIVEGAIIPFGKLRKIWFYEQLKAVAKKYKFSLDTKFENLPTQIQEIILNGCDEKFEFEFEFTSGEKTLYKQKFDGIINTLKRAYENNDFPKAQLWASSFISFKECRKCGGSRLKKENLSVKLQDEKTNKSYNIYELTKCSLIETKNILEKISFSKRKKIIAEQVIKEVLNRLGFIINLGLDYLSLNRTSRSLSGGETQRIHLASQIGTELSGVLYVLDEPSIGLHQKDNLNLIRSLKSLRDLGNTIIVVEHDREIMEQSDFLVDIGPNAGRFGGEIVFADETKNIFQNINSNSTTLKYILNENKIPVPKTRRSGNGKILKLIKCSGNNLKNINVEFPLGKFICVTGVSGSGKSSLIIETLYRILANQIYNSHFIPLPFENILGNEFIDKIIEIDQSPIGRTPRSNPATYTGVFTFIRNLFSQIPEAKSRGFGIGRFSFNVKGGRCENCSGDGIKKIGMNFLPDVYVTCEICNGKRYNDETLSIKLNEKNISEVLEMTVENALNFFNAYPLIKRKLQTLFDVGLGYIHLGQQSTLLSGGEAQRVKLATELSKIQTGNTLYILDEPTTGLHFEDINMLLSVLNKLVDKGNTVIVIEHNLDVVKSADWIIDLGIGGGKNGGEIVVCGTPEDISKHKKSHTSNFLRKELNNKN